MHDNFSTGKRENLAAWLDRIELIQGDIRDAETVRRAMAGHREGTLVAGVDYVLHPPTREHPPGQRHGAMSSS